MNQVVSKHAIRLTGYQGIALPKGARILAAQRRFGEPQMWVLADPVEPMETRWFILVATDAPFFVREGDRLDYIGSFEYGTGIFHLFELEEVESGQGDAERENSDSANI